MKFALITAADVEPVTLDRAKEHLRVTHDDDDSYIASLITAAREMAEEFTGRAFVSQVWELYLDEFPVDGIKLPLPPLSDVVSVKYQDSDNAEQTLDSAEYYVDSKSTPGMISPVNSWPSTYDRPNAVTIQFTAGYGSSCDAVPMPIKQAILLRIGEMYENREESIVGVSASSLTLTAEKLLLQTYRVNYL